MRREPTHAALLLIEDMKVLVANLGSTSFKYRLFDMAGERELARGGVERIGDAESRCYARVGPHETDLAVPIADHAEAVRRCLEQLTDPDTGCLNEAAEVAAIGFKAVHGGRLSGVQQVDDTVLAAMEEVADVAPAHNPPYVRAMRLLRERLPAVPLVAAFETGFHATIPEANRSYAVPRQWADEFGVRRWGFHGASHRYIAGRMTELLGRHDARVISCHLGGSSSLCAIRDGESVATSMGMSPQSGLPQSNRAGDFDPFALPVVMRATGRSLDEVLDDLARRSGLKGLSNTSGDVRDLEAAAQKGDHAAGDALDVFVAAVRHYLGAYLVELGGAEAIVFTGGIGENSALVRDRVCRELDWFGIRLDADRNRVAEGEACISADDSRVAVWTVPTNEELVVARQVQELLGTEAADATG